MSTTSAKLLYLHAITPVHSGTGQAAAVIDQPIAREKATGWPMIPASSLKGVLRDAHEQRKTDEFVQTGNSYDDARKLAEEDANKIYGDENRAGPLVFGDQRILCLPVRSFFGTFAYVTCPLVLQRLERDLKAIGIPMPFCKIPDNPRDSMTIYLPADNSVLGSGKVYLEDLDLNVEDRKEAGEIAEGISAAVEVGVNEFKSRFAIVSDEVFNFLSETATEVVARIAIGEEGTTSSKGGNLWYEEAVPAESIFCGPVLVADYYAEKSTLLGEFQKTLQPKKQEGKKQEEEKQQGAANSQPIVIQIGGNATVGRGLCRVLMP